MAKKPSKFDFRDVSVGLQKLRSILLGREHTKHGRFPPLLSPRTIPTPDIPRGPEYKYSKQYYYDRNVPNSIKPPVVAPIAEGPPYQIDPKTKVGPVRPDALCFACAPTPGPTWWWDGHCYYEVEPDPCPPCPNPCCEQPAPKVDPCK